jgi:hypothetical protein
VHLIGVAPNSHVKSSGNYFGSLLLKVFKV